MTIYVSDKLQATAAPVSGEPTPSTSWQWLRNNSAIAGATSSEYILTAADAGASISVMQSAINMLGTAVANSASQGPVSAFTPDLLFRNNVVGTWYDPSDTSTLFQNANGSTPVTAVEQPVGLMLDKSKGLVLGSELAPSSTPDGVGWSSQLTVSVSGNQITFGSQFANRRFSFTSVEGRWYVYTFKARRISGNTSLRFFHENSATGVTTAFTITDSVQTYTMRFQGRTGGGAINVGVQDANASGWGTIEAYDFSVRELSGNHAFNSSGNSANFPVLSARYNLLTKSEDFSDAVWVKNGASVTPNSTVAPDGSLTADTLSASSSTTTAHVYQSISNILGYTHSFYAKAGTSNFVCITTNTNACYANFNLATGVVASSANCTATITSAGNGWYKCSITNVQNGIYFMILGKDADPAAQPYGNGTWTSGNNIYIWGADLRVANDGVNLPAYQRVNTSTDYDSSAVWPRYLRFNGTNQWLQTNSIDFTGTDKMFVSAGVRKLSDAARGVLVELSASGTDLRKFVIDAPNSTTIKYRAVIPGDGVTNPDYGYTVSEFSAPHTAVVSAIMDRALFNNSVLMKVNAGLTGSFAYPFSFTDTFGNYPLYIGARAGTSLWFNGRLYSLITAGKLANAVEITETESYINSKTKAYA